MRWWRRSGLPDDLRDQLTLERGERILVAALLTGGGHAVATDRALLIAAPGGGVRRLPWHLLTSATWDADTGTISVEEVGDQEDDPGARRHHLRPAGASLLPETVRERVTSSIVVSRHVPLVGQAGVRIVGRRHPGPPTPRETAILSWQLLFDPGVDPADGAVRARAEQALEELRRSTA